MAGQYLYDRSRLVYELVVRQEPKQARMCGVGGKADRRPIDPPPIVQLRVVDPAAKTGGNAAAGPSRSMMSSDDDSPPGSPATRPYPDDSPDTNYAHSFLQNPYYFMFASLARPDDDAELHWLKDGRTRCTTGSVVSSLYHLKDPQNNNEDAGFFVFPDLSVRTEGSYRLKLSLFEVVGNNVHHCKSIYSAPFYVYTAKKFPGMEESTPLSCSLADQGIKIRIRKDIRVRKRPIPALTQPLPMSVDDESDGDDEHDESTAQPANRRNKRSRLDNILDVSGQQQLPWPPVASLNPALGPNIPPPPAAPPSATPSSSGASRSASGSLKIPPPPKPGREVPPENGIAMGVHLPPGETLPGPSVFDGRGGGIIPLQTATPPNDSPNTSGQQQQQAQPVQQQPTPTANAGPTPSTAPPQYSSQPATPATSSSSTQPTIPPPPGAQQQSYSTPQAVGPIPAAQMSQQQPHATAPVTHPQPIAPPAPPHMPPPPHMQPQHPQQQATPTANPQAAYGAPPPPYASWGAPPPPPQQAVYDPYYHHQQHYATYAPPQHPTHPQPRYDYSGMYTSGPPPPHPMGGYVYYDQHQQMMHPPPPHQPPPHHAPSHAGPPPHPYGQPPQQHPGHHPGYTQALPATPTAAAQSSINNGNTDASAQNGGTSTAPSASGSPNNMQPQNLGPQQQSATATQMNNQGMVQHQAQQPLSNVGTPVAAGVLPGTMAGSYDYNNAAMYNTGRPHPSHAPPPTHAAYSQVMPTYSMHPSAQQAPHPSMVAGTNGMPRHNPYAPPPNHQPQPQPPQMLQHHPHPHPHAHAYSYGPYGAPPPPPPGTHPAHAPMQQQHEWGAPPPQQQFAMATNTSNGGWDMYGQQQQHQQQQHPGYAPQVQVPTQGSNVTANPNGPVDRIQLAPLLPTQGNPAHGPDGTLGHPGAQGSTSVVDGSPSMRGHTHNPSSSHSSPSMGQVQLRTSGRTHGHGHGHPQVYMSGRDSGVGGSPHHSHSAANVQGKKNPLSIGSIISDDGR